MKLEKVQRTKIRYVLFMVKGAMRLVVGSVMASGPEEARRAGAHVYGCLDICDVLPLEDCSASEAYSAGMLTERLEQEGPGYPYEQD